MSYAAITKLNKSKLTLNVGDAYKLKLTGSSNTTKWSTSDKKIVIVSSEGKVKGLKAGKATITASTGSKKYNCKVTVKYDTDAMLVDTYNWVVGIWNDSFCDVYHYLEDGKNANGEEMDIEKSIEKADKYMEKLELYNDFVKSLANDEYYSDLTELWPKIVEETNYLYGRLKEETPTASDNTYDFNKTNFNDYMYELMDVIY